MQSDHLLQHVQMEDPGRIKLPSVPSDQLPKNAFSRIWAIRLSWIRAGLDLIMDQRKFTMGLTDLIITHIKCAYYNENKHLNTDKHAACSGKTSFFSVFERVDLSHYLEWAVYAKFWQRFVLQIWMFSQIMCLVQATQLTFSLEHIKIFLAFIFRLIRFLFMLINY